MANFFLCLLISQPHLLPGLVVCRHCLGYIEKVLLSGACQLVVTVLTDRAVKSQLKVLIAQAYTQVPPWLSYQGSLIKFAPTDWAGFSNQHASSFEMTHGVTSDIAVGGAASFFGQFLRGLVCQGSMQFLHGDFRCDLVASVLSQVHANNIC